MDRIFLAALFKGFPVPSTFGQSSFSNPVLSKRRAFDDARRQIIDAMIALGTVNLTVLQLATHIGSEITSQMLSHHMKRLQTEGVVRRETKKGKAVNGGQRPTLWSLVK